MKAKDFMPKMSIVTTSLLLALTGCQTTESLSFTKEQLEDPTGRPKALWKLVWSDEFDGQEIDKSKWSHEENCWGGGNQEQQCYTKQNTNSFVKDGVLHIVAKKESFTGPNNPDGDTSKQTTLPYTSARLRTLNKADWKYGRFEVRAMLPHGQGTWPAVWMLPSENKYGTWAASGEIDIVEAVNLTTQSDAKDAEKGQKEDRIHATLHYGKQWPDNVKSGAQYRLPNGVNPADGFHTYAIEWEEGEIRWYVDNVQFAVQRKDGWYSQYKKDGKLVNAPEGAPFNEKFHLLLNLAVGGSWSANTNEKGIDSSIFPQTLAVDYVRVYQCSVDSETGKGCASRSRGAQNIKGNKRPPIMVADPDYGKGKLLNIFDDKLNKHLNMSGYDPDKNITTEYVDEASRGKVLKISQEGKTGNAYLISPEVDLSTWENKGELVFDLKTTGNQSGAELLVKMDSGWPSVGDFSVPLNNKKSWREVRIKISDLKKNGNRLAIGNTVNLAKIKNILVIEPTKPMTVYLDNIRLVR